MTPEELQQIEELAAALMSPKEICVIMQIPFAENIQQFKNPDAEIYQAYHRGKYKTIASSRQFVIKLANEGSSAAQQMMQEFIEELKMREEDEIN